jgi:tRNA A37 threonylcarbamoyladenosine biosynthesis protein TsaE
MLLCELDYHLIEPWILVIEWPKQYLPIQNCEQFLVNISVLKKNKRSITIEHLTNSEITI